MVLLRFMSRSSDDLDLEDRLRRIRQGLLGLYRGRQTQLMRFIQRPSELLLLYPNEFRELFQGDSQLLKLRASVQLSDPVPCNLCLFLRRPELVIADIKSDSLHSLVGQSRAG